MFQMAGFLDALVISLHPLFSRIPEINIGKFIISALFLLTKPILSFFSWINQNYDLPL